MIFRCQLLKKRDTKGCAFAANARTESCLAWSLFARPVQIIQKSRTGGRGKANKQAGRRPLQRKPESRQRQLRAKAVYLCFIARNVGELLTIGE